MAKDKHRVQVAVGILVREDKALLIQQRRAGTACAGQWEFPGGKLEDGESPETALNRELREELGIELSETSFLSRVEHDYEHANVSLHTYLIYRWTGEPQGLEGQAISWDLPERLTTYDLLEAAHPMLEQVRRRLD